MFRILFLLWSCSLLAVSVSWGQAGKIDSTYKALIALYDSTNGDQWSNNDGWDTTGTVPASMEDFGSWYGLTVLGGDLYKIALDSTNLSGKIPPELGNLSGLGVLELQGNQLTGILPPELGNLVKLGWMELQGNQLTGEIPAEFGNLLNLRALNLQGNQLTGVLPAELGNLSKLEFLELQGNQLAGEISSELGNLLNLSTLDLQDNQFTGMLPPELGNLSQLEFLELQGNQLTGEIPATLGNLPNLLEMNLAGNQLTGQIPSALGNLETLIWLRLQDNQFMGEIPQELGNLSNLSVLNLEENQLTGMIPHSFLKLQKLAMLHLPDSVCVPQGDEFQAWLSTIPILRVLVCGAVAVESDVLPKEFVVHSNYPNPFRRSTHLVFDLPRSAHVQVEVLDITGRNVFTKPSAGFAPGWRHEIELNGMALPSGTYLYRLTATSTESSLVHTGHLVIIR